MRTGRLFVCLLAFVCACFVASAAWAQIPTGTLSGRVTSEGAGLPGVIVTATSPSLQGERQAVTSENGGYLLPLLPAGNYIGS